MWSCRGAVRGISRHLVCWCLLLPAAQVVPTMDTVRFTYLLKIQLANLNPVFFTGITGTGTCHYL